MQKTTNVQPIIQRFDAQAKTFDKKTGVFTSNVRRHETKGGNIVAKTDTATVENYFNNRRADVSKRFTSLELAKKAIQAKGLRPYLKMFYPTATDAVIDQKAAIFSRGLKQSGLLAKDAPVLKQAEVFAVIQAAAKALVVTTLKAPKAVAKVENKPMTGKVDAQQTVAAQQ